MNKANHTNHTNHASHKRIVKVDLINNLYEEKKTDDGAVSYVTQFNIAC